MVFPNAIYVQQILLLMRIKATITPSSNYQIISSSKIISFFCICLFSNNSFSQNVGEGILLDERGLELAIEENFKNNRGRYENMVSNYQFTIDKSNSSMTSIQIVEFVNGIPDVITCSFDELENRLIVVTNKISDNEFITRMKTQLAGKEIKMISREELIYKK